MLKRTLFQKVVPLTFSLFNLVCNYKKQTVINRTLTTLTSNEMVLSKIKWFCSIINNIFIAQADVGLFCFTLGIQNAM